MCGGERCERGGERERRGEEERGREGGGGREREREREREEEEGEKKRWRRERGLVQRSGLEVQQWIRERDGGQLTVVNSK